MCIAAGPRRPYRVACERVHRSAFSRNPTDRLGWLMRCPCSHPAALEACCGKFIQGWEDPPTAEELMRSRFTAYALGEIDYLIATHDPVRLPNRAQIQDWARRAKFTGLEIKETI